MYPTYGPVGVGINTLAERASTASPVPHRLHPKFDSPGWRPVTDLHDPAVWREIGRQYSDGLGTPHAAPGLLCSLQHYTGRAFRLMVAAWCADGTLLHPGHDRWWAFIDQTGATLEVSLPGTATLGRDQDPSALVDTLRRHAEPLVDVCVEAGNVTRRAALGGVAASCAGAFGAVYRTVPAQRRLAVEADAALVSGAFSDRPLVKIIRLDDPPALVHDRHTCCLIRLGSERSECGSCPQISEEQGRARQQQQKRQQQRQRRRQQEPGRAVTESVR